MEKELFETSTCVFLGCINSEEYYLKSLPDIARFDFPPEDGRCMCCGKYIRKRKPSGKAGNPRVGNSDGDYLIKRWRERLGPFDEQVSYAYGEACERCPEDEDPKSWLIDQFGQEEAERISSVALAFGNPGSSWECRDCVILDDDEYLWKIFCRLMPSAEDANG
jgi:hypothetical protein